MARPKGCDESRFWSKVAIGAADECWEWRASAIRGYGTLKVGSKSDGTVRRVGAHKFSWEIANGPVPSGLCVCHKCDNRSCVNPAHLFLGTDAVNLADRDAKGRQARGARHGTHTKPESVPRGERNGRAILKEWQLPYIEALISGGVGRRDVARAYGVSEDTISDFVRGRTWAHRHCAVGGG